MTKNYISILLFLVTSITANAQWQKVSVSGLPPSAGISKMFYDGSVLWAGSVGQVFKSADGGTNWTEVSNGLQSGISAVSGFAKSGSRMYVSFAGNGNYFTYYSTNGGTNWVLDTAGWTSIVGIMPAPIQLHSHKGYVLARLESNFILYQSDTANNWMVLNVPPAFKTPGAMYSVGDTLVLGVGTNIALSTDMGQNWTVRTRPTPLGLPMGFFSVVYQNRSNPMHIVSNYVALASSKPKHLQSFNNQMTWDSINIGLPAPAAITGMWMNGNTMIMAVEGSFTADTVNKVYYSTNAGASWTNITGNAYSLIQFKFHSISSLELINGTLYAGVNMSSGILKRDISTGINEVAAVPQLSVYPNPAQNLLHIDGKKLCALIVTDLFGKVVLSNNDLDTESIDISGLSKGIYFISALSDGKHVSARFVKE